MSRKYRLLLLDHYGVSVLDTKLASINNGKPPISSLKSWNQSVKVMLNFGQGNTYINTPYTIQLKIYAKNIYTAQLSISIQ